MAELDSEDTVAAIRAYSCLSTRIQLSVNALSVQSEPSFKLYKRLANLPDRALSIICGDALARHCANADAVARACYSLVALLDR